MNKYKIKSLIIPFILTGSIVFIVINFYSFFSQNDLIIFLIFIILVPIFTIGEFDGRIPIVYAIFLLAMAAGIPSLGKQLATFTYWLLLVGISCLLIQSFRDNDKKQDS